MTTINAALEQLVRLRAQDACEYCRIRQEFEAAPLQIDHVIARKHGGVTESENLAIACLSCNLFKGPNIAGLDPDTGSLSRLFHPRRDHWHEHFRWSGAVLLGLTPVGRTTIAVLCINDPSRVALRFSLLNEGRFP